MTDRAVIRHHADLMDRMAEATGVDLEEAMLQGRMDMDQLYDGVMRCAGCTEPGNCAHWLASRTDAADTAPDYCRNAGLLDRLRTGGRA